jgi:hypothetical protein
MHADGKTVRRCEPDEPGDMRPNVRTAILIILGAAFASFLLSVALWFGVFGDPDRQAGIFVGLWVPSILALGALLAPRGGGGR